MDLDKLDELIEAKGAAIHGVNELHTILTVWNTRLPDAVVESLTKLKESLRAIAA